MRGNGKHNTTQHTPTSTNKQALWANVELRGKGVHTCAMCRLVQHRSKQGKPNGQPNRPN
eukprot:8410322-Lingulodinium_polyedra.AAC.1